MKFQQVALLLTMSALIAMFAACGSSSSTPPAISVTFTPGFTPPASLTTTPPGNTAGIAATIMNDPNGVVNWTVTCGSAGQCGSFSPTSTASATPTTYTAPSAVPTGGTVTVTATSGTDSTKSVSGVIAIGGPGITLADGNYVFQASGVDSTEANGVSNYYVAGVFTVAGGEITGGEQDFIDFSLVAAQDQFNPATSSIVTTVDGNLQILLDTQDPNIGVGGIETLNATLVSGSRALITEFDSFATSTGTLDAQTSTSLSLGGYAFLVSGVDINNFPQGIGGILNVDGSGTISGAGSVFDINDDGVPLQDIGFGPSIVSTPDLMGRVQFNLFPKAASGIPDITLIGYIVDGNTIRVVEGTDTLVGTMGGTMLTQAKTGTFGTGDLSNSTYVVGALGADLNGFLNLAGALTFNSDLTMGGDITFNDIASQSSGAITGGTYAVDTTGRATISGLTGSGIGPGVASSAILQFYIDGNGNALVLSMDVNDVTTGPAFQQIASSSFSGSYALQGFGFGLSSGFVPWSAIGLTSTGSGGAHSGFTDFNLLATSQTQNNTLTGTSSGANDILTGTITGLDAFSNSTQHDFTYYLIDSTRLFALETDSAQLGLAYFEALSPCANCAKAKAKPKAKH